MYGEILVYCLLGIIVGGHVVQIVLDRDDWPYSAYTMYSNLLSDRDNNPFVPFRRGESPEFSAGFLALVVRKRDGTKVPLTHQFFHPMLKPFDRLRVIRQLTERYRSEAPLEKTMNAFAGWVAVHDDSNMCAALELHRYRWRALPARIEKNHPPDDDEIVIEVAVHGEQQ